MTASMLCIQEGPPTEKALKMHNTYKVSFMLDHTEVHEFFQYTALFQNRILVIFSSEVSPRMCHQARIVSPCQSGLGTRVCPGTNALLYCIHTAVLFLLTEVA